jgi:hypothetical protein
MGYILQSIAFGASGLSSIAWSHGQDDGNRLEASSLNTLACRWYSSGTSTALVYCPASWANCVASPWPKEHSSLSSWMI